MALHASTNNKASTVLGLFLSAIEEYGLPSRVRGDRGGENIQVSVYMIIARGLNRASFMWGTYGFSLLLHAISQTIILGLQETTESSACGLK